MNQIDSLSEPFGVPSLRPATLITPVGKSHTPNKVLSCSKSVRIEDFIDYQPIVSRHLIYCDEQQD